MHRTKVFGRCEVKNGMAPVERLVSEVMNQEPYKSARRVFWIMDNCSAHRGQKAVERFRTKWPNAILIHTPVYDADAEKWRAIDLVDHVNGDGLDNRRANLRVATRAENQRNTRGRPQHRASMHKGVALCAGKRVRPWRATIQIDGHQVHLGYFGEEEDAARAYNAAALLHFGEFAFLNSFEPFAA